MTTTDTNKIDDLIYLESLKRYLEAKHRKPMMCLARYVMEDTKLNTDYILCLLDADTEVKSIDINEMNLNFFTVVGVNDDNISNVMHCLIRKKYLYGAEETGFMIRLSDIEKGLIMIDKEVISDSDTLWKIKIIDNKVRLGL